MITYPIIPIWIMAIICIILFVISFLNNKKNYLQFVMIILIFIINLRIMIPSNNSEVLNNNLDVLFVVDNTISMIAEDYNGNNTRLTGVKNDCKYIINRLNGARFSVITFNNTSKVAIPYTKDVNIALETIDIMNEIDELYAKGSSLNTPIEDMLTTLKGASDAQNRTSIVFFISDGEITNETKLESYKEMKKYITNGAVLGYGTTAGGNMMSNNRYAETKDYIKYYDEDNYTYDKAVSKLDEGNLKQIASDLNIDYIHMEKQSNIEKKLTEIEKYISSNLESSDLGSYDDLYYLFVIPLFIILVLELNKYRRNFL